MLCLSVAVDGLKALNIFDMVISALNPLEMSLIERWFFQVHSNSNKAKKMIVKIRIFTSNFFLSCFRKSIPMIISANVANKIPICLI